MAVRISAFMEYKTGVNIKSWAEEDRPREKLLSKGIAALTNAELIAILIGSGTKNESAVELARKILSSLNNDLNALGKLGIKELTHVKGIGPAKAISIVAALELGRRRKNADMQAKPQITSSADAYTLMRPVMEDLPHEEFWAVFLSRSNKVLEKHHASKGGVSGTVIDVRLILREAILTRASSIILFHNHPSGNLKPSSQDTSLTRKISQAAELVDVKVIDHLIITDAGYYSFADEGML